MERSFRIERTVSRGKGVTNSGTFRTSVYYDGGGEGGGGEEQHSCWNHGGGGATVTLVDLFPKTVKPILHTLTVLLHHHISHVTTATILLSPTTFLSPLTSTPRVTLSPNGSTTLTLTARLPSDAHSSYTLLITMDCRLKLFPWESFPADPSQGIDVPPSCATHSLSYATSTDGYCVAWNAA